jgi:hypothetical protein
MMVGDGRFFLGRGYSIIWKAAMVVREGVIKPTDFSQMYFMCEIVWLKYVASVEIDVGKFDCGIQKFGFGKCSWEENLVGYLPYELTPLKNFIDTFCC